MTAHAQKACSSSRLSRRRLPLSGPSAQILPSMRGLILVERTRVSPAALNSSPGEAARPATKRASAS